MESLFSTNCFTSNVFTPFFAFFTNLVFTPKNWCKKHKKLVQKKQKIGVKKQKIDIKNFGVKNCCIKISP